MNKPGLSGTGKFHAKRLHTVVSDLCFHSKIIGKHSPGEKKLFSFPFLLFRRGPVEETGRGNRYSFPVHFNFLRYIISQEFPEKKGKARNKLLQHSSCKEKNSFRAYEKVPGTRNMILKQSNREKIQRKEVSSQKTVYNIQKQILSLSDNGSFYPSFGSLTPLNTVHKITSDTVREKASRKRAPEESLLHNSIVTRLAENSVFHLSLFHPGEKSRRQINRIYHGNEISGDFSRIPFPSKKGIRNFKRAFLKSSVSETALPDRNPVYEDVSVLNSDPFSELKVGLKSRLIMPLSPVDSGFVLDGSSGKGAYNQVPGLVFNPAGSLNQELEREMEAIKEELALAEKAAKASYSSICSKMEQELKRNLEINRISDQVIQQITMKLKIEKERKGIL